MFVEMGSLFPSRLCWSACLGLNEIMKHMTMVYLGHTHLWTSCHLGFWRNFFGMLPIGIRFSQGIEIAIASDDNEFDEENNRDITCRCSTRSNFARACCDEKENDKQSCEAFPIQGYRIYNCKSGEWLGISLLEQNVSLS